MKLRITHGAFLCSALALAMACSGGGDVAPFPDPNGFGSSSGASGSSGFGGNGNEETLIVEPRNAVLFIDTATNPATRATQAYKVIRKTPTGDKDVTAGAVFTLEKPEIGGFNTNNFESVDKLPPTPPGVTSKVTVTADGGSAGAAITLVALKRSSDQRDFFFLEPFNEAPTPANDVLKFKTNIQAVDVAFLTDTTGSMSPEIAGIRSALAGTLLTQLQAAIPSVGMAIASHEDDTDGARLVRVFQVITTSLTAAQTAAGQLQLGDGGDFPEGQIAGMFHVLTGNAVGVVPAHTPAAGTTGGVDFRAGAVPVVVLTTDATWHDPVGGVTGAQLNAAFTAKNARFVSLASGDETQANALSDATKSSLPPAAFVGCAAGMCCTGVGGAARAPTGPGGTCRLNFQYQKSSPNLGKGIVDAIKAIAVGSTYDVTAKPRNDPANPGGVDATKFMKALRAKDEGDASQGCPAHAAKDTDGDGIKDTFITVTVGTPVCFEVIPQTNTTVEPQPAAQYFNAFIDVLGVPGNINLDKRNVLFLVPPKVTGIK
ncbi:MAG: hypothetical protein HOO96_37605 [Polyangiaceae bacterium]|nr:hypothetical protein [Polyangiaceae bacterium]